MNTIADLKNKRNRFISDLQYENRIEITILCDGFGLDSEILEQLKLITMNIKPDPLDAYNFTLTDAGKKYFETNDELQVYFMPLDRLKSFHNLLFDKDIDHCHDAFEQYFRFSKEDLRGVEFALGLAKRAQNKNLSGRELYALGIFVIALEEFPLVIQQAQAEIEVSVRAGDKGFSEMAYASISINGGEIVFSSGGSVYSSDVGSDSFSNDSFVITNRSIDNSESVNDYEERFVNILRNGGEIKISSDCDFE